MDLIKIAEEAFATGKEHPQFGPGDTITIAYRIKEGNKERIQQYRGVVIRINGEGTKKRFTVRKISEVSSVKDMIPGLPGLFAKADNWSKKHIEAGKKEDETKDETFEEVK